MRGSTYHGGGGKLITTGGKPITTGETYHGGGFSIRTHIQKLTENDLLAEQVLHELKNLISDMDLVGGLNIKNGNFIAFER